MTHRHLGCNTVPSDLLLRHPANRIRTNITEALMWSTASVALWNYSKHKCSKETVKCPSVYPRLGQFFLSFLPESFFFRLVKRHLKLSDPCQSVKLTGKVLWSLSLWKSPGEIPGKPLLSGFILCLRNSFAETKQFSATSQLWKPPKSSETVRKKKTKTTTSYSILFFITITINSPE